MAFTMFDHFADVLEVMGDEDRKELLYAIGMYGLMGVEVDLPKHLLPTFIALKDDIDNSKTAHENGKTGGRPKKSQENEVIENQKRGVSENEKRGVSENEKRGVSENTKPKPNLTNPGLTKKGKEREARRAFSPPSVEQVREYVTERGYTFDPEAFVAYYESNGWMVGRNHMKDWKAACRTWQGREKKEDKDGFEQFDKFELNEDDVLVLRGGA